MLSRILSREAFMILTVALTVAGFSTQALAQYPGDSNGVVGGIGYDPAHPPPANGYPNYNDGHDGSFVNEISYEQAEAVTLALYRAVLFREGEPAGVDYWINVILTNPGTEGLLAAARGFAESDEFRQNVLPQHSDQEILQNIYGVFFNRPMDPSGAQTWGELFWQGRYGDALQGIVGSDEFANDFLR